ISNTIVVGNSSYYGTNNISAELLSNGHNIFGDTTVFGATTGDRLGVGPSQVFATGLLADNAGPTQTIALRNDPTDPALNRGAAGDDIPAIDQRGLYRDAHPDIGAFELGARLLFGSGNDDHNLNDFDLSSLTTAQGTQALGGDDTVTLSETQK